MFPVPQNCLCSPFPLIFRPLFPCSPEKIALIPQNPWEGLTLPSTIGFKLGYYAILSIVRWRKYISNQEMFGSALINDILTSCMRSSYIPWYKTEISRMGENHGKPCRVCKKSQSRLSTDCILNEF